MYGMPKKLKARVYCLNKIHLIILMCILSLLIAVTKIFVKVLWVSDHLEKIRNNIMIMINRLV